MNSTTILFTALLALGSPTDSTSTPSAPERVCLDEAHHNVHTTTRGYVAFVDLARREGYQVNPVTEVWDSRVLSACDVLVTVSPRGTGPDRSLQERGRPAFTESEVDALAEWLSAGHGLLFVTDHAPIGAASKPLGDRLGISMSNGFTEDPEHADPDAGYLVYSRANGLLSSHPVTDGADGAEGADPRHAVQTVGVFLGQSLEGAPGATSFLTLGAGAFDRYREATDRTWLDPSARDVMRPAGGRSQGLAFSFDGGRVVALADAAMLTALGRHSGFDTEGLDNQLLAVNILEWLSGRH